MSRYEDLKELANNISFATRERNPQMSDVASITLKVPKDFVSNIANLGSLDSMVNKRRHPEKELEQFVHDTAKACGLLYYHTYRSRFSEPGFPDCIIIGRYLLVVELKNTGKMPTPAQQTWLDAFKALGILTKVWRPEDKDEIVKTLQSVMRLDIK